MKLHLASPFLTFLSVVFALGGCVSPSPENSPTVEQARALYDHNNAAESESPVNSTIEITGDAGTQFYGFYVMNGEKVEVKDTVPQTITGIGITRLELRKINKRNTLAVEVNAGRTFMSASAEQRTNGILVRLDGGGSVQTF